MQSPSTVHSTDYLYNCSVMPIKFNKEIYGHLLPLPTLSPICHTPHPTNTDLLLVLSLDKVTLGKKKKRLIFKIEKSHPNPNVSKFLNLPLKSILELNLHFFSDFTYKNISSYRNKVPNKKTWHVQQKLRDYCNQR